MIYKIGINEISFSKKKECAALLSTDQALIHILDTAALTFIKKLMPRLPKKSIEWDNQDFRQPLWPEYQAISLSFDPEGSGLGIFLASGEFTIINILDGVVLGCMDMPKLWGSSSLIQKKLQDF